MPTLENQMTSLLTKALRARGAHVFVIAGGNVYQSLGLPDRLIVYRGIEHWLEMKTWDRQVTTVQRLNGRKLQNMYVLRLNRAETEMVLTDADETIEYARLGPLDAQGLLDQLDACSSVVLRSSVGPTPAPEEVYTDDVDRSFDEPIDEPIDED